MWVVNFKTIDKKESSHSFKIKEEAERFLEYIQGRSDTLEHKLIGPSR